MRVAQYSLRAGEVLGEKHSRGEIAESVLKWKAGGQFCQYKFAAVRDVREWIETGSHSATANHNTAEGTDPSVSLLQNKNVDMTSQITPSEVSDSGSAVAGSAR